MARKSRRHPVRGFIGWQRAPAQSFIRKHLVYQEVSAIKDTRVAIKVIEKDLANVLNGIKDLSEGAIRYALKAPFELSQKYCPVDTGRLVASGYLTVSATSYGPRGEVGYAPRNNPPYAVWVHERTDLHHKAPTRAKFLQAALEETQGQLLARVDEYLATNTGIR